MRPQDYDFPFEKNAEQYYSGYEWGAFSKGFVVMAAGAAEFKGTPKTTVDSKLPVKPQADYINTNKQALKTWTSADKYVGETANAIEVKYPGKVVDVNKKVFRADGTPLTDYDIELDNAIIQVKKGGGKGTTKQAINTAPSTRKEVIVYLPDQNPSAAVVKWLQKEGFNVFTNQQDLLNYLK